jgi:basic amino acid/polyamine antiporter, APA family
LPARKPTELVQALGRWSLTALVINSIVGSGIFGLPAVVAVHLGRASPLAYLLAAGVVGIVMGCFAEVASQFSAAGGPYLYARVAFGRFLGLQTAWLSWLSRLSAGAAAADLFTTYLAVFWPASQQRAARLLIIFLLVATLALTNIVGVKSGARMSNVFTIAKLAPLSLFTFAGLVFLAAHFPAASAAPAPATHLAPSAGDWFESALVLIFAYGGFEGAMVPMSEARDPRRDAPFALGIALVAVTALYALIQIVVVGVVADPGATDRPLAVAAGIIAGPAGATFMSASALLCLYGYLSAQMLHTPRLTMALAEQGDFPRFFAAINARFRTPVISILVYAALLATLAAVGNFRWNVLLSAVARLFTYGLVCGALLVLRRRNPGAQAYRLPGGQIFAALGIAFMAVLLTRMHRGEFAVIVAVAVVSLLNWFWSHAATSVPTATVRR